MHAAAATGAWRSAPCVVALMSFGRAAARAVLPSGGRSGRIDVHPGNNLRATRDGSDGVTEFRASSRPRGCCPTRVRSVRPPRWWQEIGFIAHRLLPLLDWCVTRCPAMRPAPSIARTRSVDRARAHIDVEQSLNLFVDHQHWLAYVCNYYYSTLHFIVTIAVLVWLYLKHPLRYRAIRSVLLLDQPGGADRVLVRLGRPAADAARLHRHRDRVSHLGLARLAGLGEGVEPVRRDAFAAHRLGAVVRAGHRRAGGAAVGASARACSTRWRRCS